MRTDQNIQRAQGMNENNKKQSLKEGKKLFLVNYSQVHRSNVNKQLIN